MEDPMNDLGPEAAALVAAARRGDDPTPEDHARVRAALAGRLAAAAIVTGTVAASRSAAAGMAPAAPLAAAKLASILVVAGAVGAVGIVESSHRPAHVAVVASRGAPVASAVAARSAVRAPVPELPPAAPGSSSADPVTLEHPEPSPALPVRSVPARPMHDRPAVPGGELEGELPVIAKARIALASGDAAAALRSLDLLAQRLPRGGLAQEREALAVQALCDLGDVERARERATRFLGAFPDSPYAAAVRSTCREPERQAPPL
jgi:hypothetical protein